MVFTAMQSRSASAAIGSRSRCTRFLDPSGIKMMTPGAAPVPKLTRAFRRVHIVHMAVRLLPGPFTVDAYHRLAELGILDEDDRVELLDGQIVEMTPIGGAHAACVIRLNDLLSRPSGSDTSEIVRLTRGEALRPLRLPGVAVAVAEVLG